MKEALTFDDVCLVPQYNNVASRVAKSGKHKIDLSAYLFSYGRHRIDVPILAANMDTVTGPELARELIKWGTTPIFHRFTDFETKLSWVKEFDSKMILSVGTSKDDIAELQELLRGAESSIGGICIDIAHGHSEAMLTTIKSVKKVLPDLPIIAGNVCTAIATQDLITAGADCIKVGIGPGAACTTRMQTGFGVPQFTAIRECSRVAKKFKTPIIADGGIRGPNDIAKALAAGASCVMMGKMFALTKESAAEKAQEPLVETSKEFIPAGSDGNEIDSVKTTLTAGPLMAKYRGQASKDFQDEFKGGLKPGTVAEGEAFWAPVTGTVEDLLNELTGALRSAFTYAGAKHLGEFQDKVEFRKVCSAYLTESNIRK